MAQSQVIAGAVMKRRGGRVISVIEAEQPAAQ